MCMTRYVTPEEAEAHARKFDFWLTRIQDYAKATVPLPPEGELDALEWDKVVKEIHSEAN